MEHHPSALRDGARTEATPGEVRQQEAEPGGDEGATGRGEGEDGGGCGEQNSNPPGRAKFRSTGREPDGCKWRHVQIRMAMAISAFGQLSEFWKDERLSKRLKLNVYS